MADDSVREMRDALARLEARVANQEAELARYRRATARRPRQRRAVLIAVALTAVLTALLPLGLLAAGNFGDVPPSNQFYNNINNIAAAGITHGCDNSGGTLYCPALPVRRDEMAAFLNRGLGRLSTTTWSFMPLTSKSPIASVQITTEGTEYITATASFYTVIYSGQAPTSFPCEGTFYLSVDGQIDNGSFTGVIAQTSPDAPYRSDGVTSQATALVGPGTHTVELVYVLGNKQACAINAGNGRLTAQVVPFGSTGAAASGLPTTPGVPSSLDGR
ncbi:MAG: S-layer homology domain-containing protein [Thermomicrobiales bacterium]